MRTIVLSTVAVLSMLLLGTSSTEAFAAPQPKSQMVAVQPGDSLSKIADANSSTAQRLFDANTSVQNPDLIYPGNQLRVPSATEELATRPMPNNTPVAQTVAPAVESPAPQQSAARARVSALSVAGGSVWDQLALCESGGNWAISTGNGFYGGIQFTISSWQAVGGSGLPSDASREEQIMRGQTLQSMQGWGAWPACASKLGLR